MTGVQTCALPISRLEGTLDKKVDKGSQPDFRNGGPFNKRPAARQLDQHPVVNSGLLGVPSAGKQRQYPITDPSALDRITNCCKRRDTS